MFSEIIDDGLGSLACLMALVTWLLTRKFGGTTEAVVRKLPVAAESDEEIWSETETVSVPLDTTRKYHVSSSGRKVHLFADCLGSNCPGSLPPDVRTLCRSLSRTSQLKLYYSSSEIKLQEGVSWLFVAVSCFCSQQSVCQSAARAESVLTVLSRFPKFSCCMSRMVAFVT